MLKVRDAPRRALESLVPLGGPAIRGLQGIHVVAGQDRGSPYSEGHRGDAFEELSQPVCHRIPGNSG